MRPKKNLQTMNQTLLIYEEEEETNVHANEELCQTEKKENLRKPINAVTEKKIEIFLALEFSVNY